MPFPVSSIGGAQIAEAIRLPGQSGKPGEFMKVLEKAIGAVEQPRSDASQQVQKFLSGENEEVHSVALATEKAELVFDLGLQVRNKVVDAYQEVMKMQM
jgi:flagellar hook-basal body complex protein FliE